MCDNYGPILTVEQKSIVGNLNLASNRDYSHGANIIHLSMLTCWEGGGRPGIGGAFELS